VKVLTALLCVTALVACAGRDSGRRPPSAPASPAASGARVLLLWSEPVDLDLYVTEPSLETVYFANPSAQTGGRLERDVTCGTIRSEPKGEPLFEEVRWNESGPGRYRVGVDFVDACGSGTEETAFRVVAEISGERREWSGMVRRERFQAIVVEFDVTAK
jgi:hypothetical protein